MRLGERFSFFVELCKLSSDYSGKNLGLSVNICNSIDQKVLQFSNKFIEYPITIDTNRVLIRIDVDRFPLMKGRYHVRFFIDDGVDILDWIDDAYYFSVEDNNYYGKGMIENSALFMADFSFKKILE